MLAFWSNFQFLFILLLPEKKKLNKIMLKWYVIEEEHIPIWRLSYFLNWRMVWLSPIFMNRIYFLKELLEVGQSLTMKSEVITFLIGN